MLKKILFISLIVINFNSFASNKGDKPSYDDLINKVEKLERDNQKLRFVLNTQPKNDYYLIKDFYNMTKDIIAEGLTQENCLKMLPTYRATEIEKKYFFSCKTSVGVTMTPGNRNFN